MSGAKSERIEAGVDTVAAAFFAAGTALVLILLAASNLYVLTASAVAFAGCFYGLRSIEPEYAQFSIPRFQIEQFQPLELDELKLTDADRLAGAQLDDALILDDILAEIGPDSRVVRLFDRDAMPSPGQLIARIDDHLGISEGASVPQDASEALSEALAQLRRSLR